MNIQQFKELTARCPLTSEIRMSNNTKEYTVNHPEETRSGSLCFDGYAVSFFIDWNDQCHSTLEDFYKLIEQHELGNEAHILSEDVDDMSEIQFQGVHIHGNSIILIIE